MEWAGGGLELVYFFTGNPNKKKKIYGGGVRGVG